MRRSERGLVFDIQGHSIHDGPGCRTLVFLSGCPLRCEWCSNPEGQLQRLRLMVREARCKPSSFRCAQACPHGAVRIETGGPGELPRFDRSLCDRCPEMKCVEACWHDALNASGRTIAPDELMAVLRRDQSYWGEEGGVTFTGGEPLLQPEFLTSVLESCQDAYIQTAIETSAHVETEVLLSVLPYTDWIFVDVKHMESAPHREKTGVDNALILGNIGALSAARWDGRLVIRLTVIPGFNDTAENLGRLAAFMKRLSLEEIHLLPFHRLGSSKYEQLGLTYAYADHPAPSRSEMSRHQAFFESAGLRCYLDDETPF